MRSISSDEARLPRGRGGSQVSAGIPRCESDRAQAAGGQVSKVLANGTAEAQPSASGVSTRSSRAKSKLEVVGGFSSSGRPGIQLIGRRGVETPLQHIRSTSGNDRDTRRREAEQATRTGSDMPPAVGLWLLAAVRLGVHSSPSERLAARVSRMLRTPSTVLSAMISSFLMAALDLSEKYSARGFRSSHHGSIRKPEQDRS